MRTIISTLVVMLLSFLLGFFRSYGEATTNQESKRKSPQDYVYRVYYHSYNHSQQFATAFKLRYKNKNVMMTAGHVCQSIEEDKATADIGIETSFRTVSIVKVIAYNMEIDLCLLSMPYELDDDKSGLKLGDRQLYLGESLYTIGFPGKRNFKIIIRSEQGQEDFINQIDIPYKTKITFFPETTIGGQSGSPVLNQFGEVIGVLVVGRRDAKEGGFTNLGNLRAFLYKHLR